ncbi:lipopolysaccharide biosynthesis protein [Roseibium sp. MMSF_3412]|uniref:lipopolysaccharide biosynthesis protein n=1 Tax=Roseibium sp. MMSF_3412 TaxID=3046712 RepID=UPI00273E7946|nr:lipopolysaccharide biosynthesis protein [Roseibium sp. MMSF_3412]
MSWHAITARLDVWLGIQISGVLRVLTGSVAKLAIQLGQFVIVARLLGPAEFGEFAAIVALCAGTSALVGWGSANLYVRDVTRRARSENDAWWRLVGMTVISFCVVAPLIVVASVGVFGLNIALGAVLSVILADLFLARFVNQISFVLLTHNHSGATALNDVVFAFSRLAFAGLFAVMLTEHTANTWAVFYVLATVCSAGVALISVRSVLRPVRLARITRQELTDGAAFSLGTSAHMMRRQIDRPISQVMLSSEAAGLYASAARLSEAAIMPIAAFFRVAYRRFFQTGSDQGQGALRSFALRVGTLILLVSLSTAGALWVAADYLHYLLGPAYRDAGSVLKVLAILPVIHAVTNLCGDILSGLDRQWTRFSVELVALALKSLILVILVQKGGSTVMFAAFVVAADALGAIFMMWRSYSGTKT